MLLWSNAAAWGSATARLQAAVVSNWQSYWSTRSARLALCATTYVRERCDNAVATCELQIVEILRGAHNNGIIEIELAACKTLAISGSCANRSTKTQPLHPQGSHRHLPNYKKGAAP